MRTKMALIGALLGLGVGIASFTTGHAGAGPPEGNFSLAEAERFTEFPLYYAGDNVIGLPLNYVLRQPIGTRGNTVSFIYGDCTPTGRDGGCAPPLEIQIWPACVRNPSLYRGQGPLAPVPDKTTSRGVPAASFEAGRRLEIQTGASTVVIFAHGEAEATTVAASLRGVNVPVQTTNQLPKPPSGALNGTLRC